MCSPVPRWRSWARPGQLVSLWSCSSAGRWPMPSIGGACRRPIVHGRDGRLSCLPSRTRWSGLYVSRSPGELLRLRPAAVLPSPPRAPERLAAAITLNYASFTGAAIAGPVVGGILIAAVGLPAASPSTPSCFWLLGCCSLSRRSRRCPTPPAQRGGRCGGSRFALRPLLSTFAIDLGDDLSGCRRCPILALDVFGMGQRAWACLRQRRRGAFVGESSHGLGGRSPPGQVMIIAVAVWGIAITGFGLPPSPFPLRSRSWRRRWRRRDQSSSVRDPADATPDELRGRCHLFTSWSSSAGRAWATWSRPSSRRWPDRSCRW
jgi:hypothetical protein